jgi:hypothetical protein
MLYWHECREDACFHDYKRDINTGLVASLSRTNTDCPKKREEPLQQEPNHLV